MTENTRLVDPDGKPLERIHGFETEYSSTCFNKRLEGSWQLEWLTSAVAHYSTLTGRHDAPKGFDEYQNFIYLDVGLHPELCTAEELSFAGSALRLILGHLIMAKRHLAALQRCFEPKNHRLGVSPSVLEKTEVYLHANTCDNLGNSWASHENQLVLRNLPIGAYGDALMAHRASRIVWSGAGWPKRISNVGFEFHLSEKAEFIVEETSNETSVKRGLLNERDEPLANPDKYRRIHGITGESVFSPDTNKRRVGSESIILRACELGVDFSDLVPLHPVQAMHDISADPTLKQKVSMRNGGSMTGIDIQRALAERSLTAAIAAGYITAQEVALGEDWIAILGKLERDPTGCRLDWVAKRHAIESKLVRKRPAGKTDYEVAWRTALEYHQLLPVEGRGMHLLRKGFFEAEGQPATDLGSNPPLPENRTGLRSKIIEWINRYPQLLLFSDWHQLRVTTDSSTLTHVLKLDEPYQAEEDAATLKFRERVSGLMAA